ncbi:dihydrofolate reductase isoform X3 [Ictidomys tridecemlineatus]|nr:dihydrofolate reductase [Ictidomys tridecemlineatus]
MTTTPSVEGKQNLVIMGRKTWFSIPEKNRPLKDRINIVLSRELKELPQGAHFLAKSLTDALKLTEQPELASKIDMIWIVGGSSVYKEAMIQPGHIKLFVTRIMQEFESDTFFPEIDLKKYKLLPERVFEGNSPTASCDSPLYFWACTNITTAPLTWGRGNS